MSEQSNGSGDQQHPAEDLSHRFRVGGSRRKAPEHRSDRSEEREKGYQPEIQPSLCHMDEHRRSRRKQEVDQIYSLSLELTDPLGEHEPDHQQPSAAYAETREHRDRKAYDKIKHKIPSFQKTYPRPDHHRGEDAFQPLNVEPVEQKRSECSAEHPRQKPFRS